MTLVSFVVGPRRCSVAQLSVIKPVGDISSDDASATLTHVWAPMFAEAPVSLALACVALVGRIICCPPDVNPTAPSCQSKEKVDSLFDSGVGTDTLLCSCWQRCQPAAQLALYSC